MIPWLCAVALAQDLSDPYLLPIPKADSVSIGFGWTDLKTGKASSPDAVAKAARKFRFVMVGENHDNAEHHLAQAAIIEALVKDGRKVAVGFEMFTRDNQASLSAYTTKDWTFEDFQAKTNWEKQWGFPFPLYQPIFEATRRNTLPMVALNFPRDWVRAIGKGGPGVLTDEQKKWAPDISLDNENHKKVFTALMGGHPMTGPQADNIYAAQVSWDEAMATSAADFMKDKTGDEWVMVICAGGGHTMYSQGIGYRLKKKGFEAFNVTCFSSPEPRAVSRGFADVAVLTVEPER
jgi:uncharacterized iron-regulated protein